LKLLLDTHVWIWSLVSPERLVRRVAKALESRSNELWLSPISIWEALLLVEKGKLTLEGDVDDWFHAALEEAPLREAPLTREIALETRHVELPYRDPADRFLLATARVLDLTLVTADERLLAAKAARVLPNR
jgi:PIN domain nuclease of toxin-antitoxin system